MSARSSDEGLGRDEGVKKVTVATSLVGEIEYEFDVTKVTSSVNFPTGIRLSASECSLLPP
jgi:hypothetical protein